MEKITIKKADGLRGELTLPGDKSISHRAIIFSSLADGQSELHNLCTGEDVGRTVDIFRHMGIAAESCGPGSLRITGKGLHGLHEPMDILYTGNSGTTTRLMAGLLSAQPFFSVLSGDASLNSRPMKRIVEPLRKMGAQIAGRADGTYAPLAITGSRLHGIQYSLQVASAQIKSALMLAALYADGSTAITEPSVSRDHTERMLLHLGIPVSIENTTVRLSSADSMPAQRFDIPGDISSAAFFMVAALIVPGSEILLRGVGINPTRTGIIDILRNMGGDIELLNERMVCGEPVADICVRASRLRGTDIASSMIPRAIDEIPIVAIAAACADGTTVVRDARELRVKESDRIAVMTRELRKCGIRVEEQEDGMTITGAERLTGAVCESHGDHRIAMSFAVAGLVAHNGITVMGSACIDTSFPEFMSKLSSLKK